MEVSMANSSTNGWFSLIFHCHVWLPEGNYIENTMYTTYQWTQCVAFSTLLDTKYIQISKSTDVGWNFRGHARRTRCWLPRNQTKLQHGRWPATMLETHQKSVDSKWGYIYIYTHTHLKIVFWRGHLIINHELWGVTYFQTQIFYVDMFFTVFIFHSLLQWYFLVFHSIFLVFSSPRARCWPSSGMLRPRQMGISHGESNE